MRFRSRRVCLALAVCLLYPLARPDALMQYHITAQVPIERVTQNLERRARQQPRDIETRLNLARVYAMAFASKSETTEVLGSIDPKVRPSVEPFFGYQTSAFGDIEVVPAATRGETDRAKRHLASAIDNYKAAIAIAPTHLIARLGLAWCLQQSGDNAGALAGYRGVFEDAWKKESAGDLPGLQNFTPLTVEVSGYLLTLLDPVRGADEVATIRSRVSDIQRAMARRPISPIVIPLENNLSVLDLVDRSASVVFDADGSGIAKRWSWISPKAGWLVFDKSGRKRIDSALMLFGNVTFWLFWENGYHAMRSLDDDGDGELAGREFEGLAIWRDVNGNGVSEPGEVRTLPEWGIRSLSCADQPLPGDSNVAAWSPAGVTFDDGTTRPTYDVLLYPADSES